MMNVSDLDLSGGFKYVFLCLSLLGEDDPI